MTNANAANMRFGCWLIDNIKHNGEPFTKTVYFNGNRIDLMISNFGEIPAFDEHLNDLIHDKILNFNTFNGGAAPSATESIYVITTSGYNLEDPFSFTWLFNLCLRLVYYQPTLVSSVAEALTNGTRFLPKWEGFKSVRVSSLSEINSTTFDKVLTYFNLLSTISKAELIFLEEIYKITTIDDVLISLLALYSFIEGFWHNHNGESNLTNSFNAMLGFDFAPGKEHKPIRDKIKKQIEEQNGLLRNGKLDDMRHILAHGMYKKLEGEWKDQQWQAIYDQRQLITDIVIESLINKIANGEQLA